MRILQIANDYLGSKLYSLLFQRLEDRGHSHSIFVPVNYNFQKESYRDDVHVVPCFDQIDRLLFFRKQKKMLAWMEENLDMKSFRLTHAHTVFSAGYAALQLKKKYGIPYIVAVRDTDVNIFFKYMLHLRHTGVEVLKNASQIIFLSPSYREKVLRDYVPLQDLEAVAEKCRVIPNGISQLFLESDAQPKTAPQEPLKLICVGLLKTRKNPELTVEAVKLLRSQGKDVTVTFIGEIREEKYKEMVKSHDFITYLPRCPQTEVIGHLRGADIFVMPSHTETFGLAYAEAMSQGLPVIYTAGQGFDGQFPEGHVGHAVPATDARALADAIEKVVENYAELSKNAIPAARRFDWNTIADEYNEIYRECCR